ncbi:hypothetical protein EXIGLDRAFT_832478 [Exidia glandulosa HHB12029]|uniref:F-box domain-containing protein n=1 Tax=Exidia glandulosa HHB12029 TaxID=1314781 RepID=A0A165LLV8_EXIGL|nr:hypothetical protein EXIGLDRAFT_832478 [Exidia glandulosa HHB12029]
MDSFAALPFELALLIAEYAAWDEVHRNMRWVASTRFVCRQFNSAIRRICFDTLIWTRGHEFFLPELEDQPDTPFSLTRRLAVLLDDPGRDVLAPFTSVQDFTGSPLSVETFQSVHPSLRLQSIFLTLPTRTWHFPTTQPLTRWVFSIPRAHIICDITYQLFSPDTRILESANTQWLLVDAFSAQSLAFEVADIQLFFSRLTKLLALPLLKRLLLRQRIANRESRYIFCDAAVSWASVVRDERIWLDTTDVGAMDYDHMDSADALAGHKLWEAGVPLYVKGPDP